LAGAVTDIAHVRERVLVGIDGPPAAGKTTLPDQLASRLRLHAVRASVEAFLLPQQIRYQRGELSPDGCYRDSLRLPRSHERADSTVPGGRIPGAALQDHRPGKCA
jgi:uridine kinase